MRNDPRILSYAKANYRKMFRESDGIIHHPFIVPGSCYDNCLWDWDSWLTNIALRQFVTDDISEYEKGCILNFLEHMDDQGRIPIVILPDRTMPELSTQPDTNIHKPCLAQHAAFIVRQTGEAEWLRPYFDRLLCFIRYYEEHCRHESGLYFWIDDFAIGVDNDPCTFYRPKRSSASIFLNCLMYRELLAVCFLGEALGVDVAHYRQAAEVLKIAVQTHCYDEKDGFYYSVDLNLLPIETGTFLHSGAPRHWNCLIQRIGCWSGFLAMWSGIATKEQAERMVRENLLDKNAFWAPFGVRTLSSTKKCTQLFRPIIRPVGWGRCGESPITWYSADFYGMDMKKRQQNWRKRPFQCWMQTSVTAERCTNTMTPKLESRLSIPDSRTGICLQSI